MTDCPSDLKLEAYLVAPPRSDVASHLEGCASCRERVVEMRRLEDEFRREVYPATLGAVVAAARPPPRRVPRWSLVVGPLAAAAALAIAIVWHQRADAGMSLAVYASAPAGEHSLPDGAVVQADAALRFEVEPNSPCCLWVLAVDAAGDIVRLYPPRGDTRAEALVHPPTRQRLPTIATLDGRSGPQRIFAVCTKSPVPWAKVRGVAAENLRKGDEAVRSLRALDGLPPGAVQSSVLLEKKS